MESVEGIFSGLSDTLKTNFVPIAVVLALVLLVVGWMAYKSFTGPSKNDDSEPDSEHSDGEDSPPPQAAEQTEHFADDENAQSE